jgi:peptidoglycan/xylan/chitin deacetylase (PgdA/CDA1 family)
MSSVLRIKKINILSMAITFVFVSSFLIACYPNENSVARASSPAWDFEDHTYDHQLLTSLSIDQIVNELNTTNSVFQAHGLPSPKHLSYPNGAYNSTVVNIVSSYRLSGRTTNGPKPDTSPIPWYTLNAVNINSSTTFDKVKGWIDTAVSQKGLLNIFTHDVQIRPNTYGTTPQLLQQVLDYLANQQDAGNLTVMTIRQAYTEYSDTKAIVVMSFDDGYATDYSIVWPMFVAHGLSGTSYIIASRIDHLDPTALTWDMVYEMAQTQPSSTITPNPTVSQTPISTPLFTSTNPPPPPTSLPIATPSAIDFNESTDTPAPTTQIPEFHTNTIFMVMIAMIAIIFLGELVIKRKTINSGIA